MSFWNQFLKGGGDSSAPGTRSRLSLFRLESRDVPSTTMPDEP